VQFNRYKGPEIWDVQGNTGLLATLKREEEKEEDIKIDMDYKIVKF